MFTEAMYAFSLNPMMHQDKMNPNLSEWSCVSYTGQGDYSLVLAISLQVFVLHLTIHSIENLSVISPNPAKAKGLQIPGLVRHTRYAGPHDFQSWPPQSWESPDSFW